VRVGDGRRVSPQETVVSLFSAFKNDLFSEQNRTEQKHAFASNDAFQIRANLCAICGICG